MKALTDLMGSNLEWTEPKAMERAYELRDGASSLCATLSFRTACGSLAVAETAHGSWSFKRVGFLNPRITVRVQGAAEDLAVFEPRFFSGGELVFADGLRLRWEAGNMWQTQWAFLDPQQQPLVRFGAGPPGSGIAGLFKTQAAVTVQRSGLPVERVAILLALGFYLVVLQKEDAASGAAVAAVVASY